MKPSVWLLLAGLLGAAGVGLGAYGAHGLDTLLAKKYLPGAEESWSAYPPHAVEVAGQPDQLAATFEIQKRIDVFNTAVRYQMWHALALVGVALLATQVRSVGLNIAGFCFLVGIVLFSGLLFAWSLGGPPWLVRVVPLGGVSFMIGWVALAFSGFRLAKPAVPTQ